MHLNELLRWAVGNLAMFVFLTAPLEFTFEDEKLLERSGHGLWESFPSAFLCVPAVPTPGAETPGDGGKRVCPLPSVPISASSTLAFDFIQEYVWEQLLVHFDTRQGLNKQSAQKG